MKKITFLLIQIILFVGMYASSSYAQKWTPSWQYESRARDVKFVDAGTGYMTFTPHILFSQNPPVPLEATYGLLLRTNDAGQNWTQQKFDSLPNILAMDFVDANNGFMGGQDLQDGISTILKTTNGGASWAKRRVANIRFVEMDMATNQHIYLIGKRVINGVAKQDSSVFMRTSNGGSSWHSRVLNYEATSIFFLNQSIGFMTATNSYIYKTTNGGQSWNIHGGLSIGLKKIYFINNQLGFVIGQNGLIGQSTDGGLNWAVISFGGQNNSYNFNSIHFSSPTTGFMCATDDNPNSLSKGYIFKSTDAGLTWSAPLPHPEPLYGLSGMGNSVYCIGNHGRLVRTINNGQDWQTLMGMRNNMSASDMHFPTNKTGYVLGGVRENDQFFSYLLSKTTNAGQSWLSTKISNLLDSVNLKSIFFSDSLTGYICGEKGKIYKTINGGVDWVSQNSGVLYNLYEITFVSPSVGFAVGGLYYSGTGGVVLKTTNAGVNWEIALMTNRELKCMSFASPMVGYVGGRDGQILKTTTAGEEWFVQRSNPLEIIEEISAGNANYAMALVDIYKKPLVISAGQTAWDTTTIIPNLPNLWFSALAIRNNLTILAGISFSENDRFDIKIATNNNNNNASSQYVSEPLAVPMLSFRFLRVNITPDMSAYALDMRGVVLKKFDQLTNTKPKTKLSSASLTFSIYPNPSSGACVIEISEWQQTKMSVVDALGRNIIQDQTLLGSQTRLMLNKGVYFVRLSRIGCQGMQKLIVY